MTESPEYRTPRWVKVLGTIVGVILLFGVVLHLPGVREAVHFW